MNTAPPNLVPPVDARWIDAFRHLFPSVVTVAVSDGMDSPTPLMDEELATVAKAVPSRQREFALGRWCARRALGAFGLEKRAIPVGVRNAPIWPTGIVGSITHCTEFVGAAIAHADRLRAIGFDAERDEPLATDLVSMICTAREVEWLENRASSGADWAKVIFSAKEAVHKCIWPLCGKTLDFLDVTLAIDSDAMAFSVRETRRPSLTGLNLDRINGRIAVAEPFIFTSAFMDLEPPN